MASLSLVGSAAQKPAVVFGNQFRPAPFSQLIAKSGKKAANPSRRCYVANSAASNGADALTGNGSLSLSDQLLEDDFHRPHKSFDQSFIFGGASSSFQVEGATKIGGRGPTIWDTFCEKFPGKIADGGNGEPGAGSYEFYQEDVDLLHDLGLKAYRFSICWSRVLPNGKKDDPNEEGIQYYKRLIKALKAKGIEPFVTLFHWEVPQALEDEYGGFLSRKIIEDFKGYAELCFERFGDDVKYWTTLNEASMFANMGYCYGMFAPGHCTPDVEFDRFELICPVGDSLREPYRVAHNILLSHAESVKLYRDKFQEKQRGQIGINVTTKWFEPYDSTNPLDIEAQNRALEFNLGWIMDPLRFGKYPFSMRALVGERLQNFTPEESDKLKNSYDFIGINYYTAMYAQDKDYDYTQKPVLSENDMFVKTTVDKEGEPIGPAEEDSWVNVYPRGLHKLLLYVKNRYGNPPVYITENGVLKYDVDKELRRGFEDGKRENIKDDLYRVEYHSSHLQALEDALRSGADVRGYFFWSLLDSFEWRDGYTARFGLVHVDRGGQMKRDPKRSAIWLRDNFLNSISGAIKAAKTTHVLPRGRTIIKEEVEEVEEAAPAAISK